MIKFGKGVVKCRFLILILAFLLLIPSAIGYMKTRINYDILSYLPGQIETMKGQDILLDEFGTGAFSFVVVEGMQDKDLQKIADKIEDVPHVKNVIWYGSIMDFSIPREALPDDIYNFFNNKDADSQLMAVLFDESMSSDGTMDAIQTINDLVGKQCFVSGMASVNNDIRKLAENESVIYVLIAVVLSLIVLSLTMDSVVVPFLFLISIGMAIIYNLGSNVFFGEISYITKALAAVLQLGVTMDYSIFLLSSYEENKERFPDDRERAMGHAIANTFKSIVGSSVTTIAGFAALCFMTFALGRDLGIVSAKGVVIGVICCVTVLPAMILIFDKPIEKTKHKPLIKSMDRLSGFITKHYKIWLVIFLVLLAPAIYGNSNTKIYYNIAKSLPSTLESNVANEKLEEDFDMSVLHMVMMDKNMDAKDKRDMLNAIDEVDGVKWTISLNSLVGATIPDSMIPKDIKSMLQSDNWELAFVCSKYQSATEEVNSQIAQINDIVKGYDENAMVIGEAPMMKDLEDVTNIDLQSVNTVSMAAIFIIIMIIFKSISLPIILVAVIEFAIAVNMAVPFYQNISLPFVASIVVGTIQLGATVDYAILMTSRYQKERNRGKNKKEAVSAAHKASIESIITSGLSFFAATFGVSAYSKVDMIGSICTLLSRGALISVVVVALVLPAMFLIFDKVICKTSINFLGKK